MFREIKINGITYGVIGNTDDLFGKTGWSFLNMPDEPLQVGIGNFKAGDKGLPHQHLIRERIHQHKTLEFIYVVSGFLTVTFYDLEQRPVHHEPLLAREFVIFIDGSHGIEYRKNNTVIIEVKNGPYVSVEKDKVRF